MDDQPFDYRKQFKKQPPMDQAYINSRSPPPPYYNQQPNPQPSHNAGFDGACFPQHNLSGQPTTYNLQLNLHSSTPSPSNALDNPGLRWTNNSGGNMPPPSNFLNNAGFGWNNPSDRQLQQAHQIHHHQNQGHLSPVYSPQVSVSPSYISTPISAQLNRPNDPRLQWGPNPPTQSNEQQLHALMQQQINSLPSQSYSSQPILEPAIQSMSTLPNERNAGLKWATTTSGQVHYLQQQSPHILQPQNTSNQHIFPNSSQSITQLSTALSNMSIPLNTSGQNHQQFNPHLQPINPQTLAFQSQPIQPFTMTSAQVNHYQQQSPHALQESLSNTSLLYNPQQSTQSSSTPNKTLPSNLLIDFGFDSNAVPEPSEEQKPEPQQSGKSTSPISQKPQFSPQSSHKTTFIASPADLSEDIGIEWVKTTPCNAYHLKGRAVVSSKSIRGDLWVIRSWHNDELIPGKMFVNEKTASITYAGKVIKMNIETIEVLCAKPNAVKWVAASRGSVPVGAIPAGFSKGETLYVGRGQFKLFKYLTPGKVHPSHKCCYIVFAGKEIPVKHYDVLTRV